MTTDKVGAKTGAIRTFPIRVAPIIGEALDSWLEALAHRTHTRYGDVLHDLGLAARTKTGNRERDVPNDWTIMLRSHEASAIAQATGVDMGLLHAMTLAHFNERAVHIDEQSRIVNRLRLWSRATGSRYCPHCLAESEGRWQLTWRLGWSFACVLHCCLLADYCPNCHRVPRFEPFPRDRVPEPGHCGTGSSRRGQRGKPPGCGQDLRQAASVDLPEGHPVLVAQQQLSDTIETNRATFGLYARCPQPALVALSEMRAVASRILVSLSAPELSHWLPSGIAASYVSPPADHSPESKGRRRPGIMTPSAADTSIAISAAMRILGDPDPRAASAAMRELIATFPESPSKPTPTILRSWGSGTGVVLRSIQIAALGPSLRSSDQLRLRTNVFPTRSTTLQQAQRRACSLPGALWPSWTVRIPLEGVYPRVLAPTLAAAVLLVGTKLKFYQIVEMLGEAARPGTVPHILHRLRSSQFWEPAALAIVRLADFLDDNPAPIDYDRRRSLDYTGLLPADQWVDICQKANCPAGGQWRARVARCALFTRISGMPVESFPARSSEMPHLRTASERFTALRTPQLAQAMDEAALEFIETQGVRREPLTWNAPLFLLDGLNLPDPGSCIDIDRLHRLVRDEQHTLTSVADTLGTSLEVIRIVLGEHPAPAAPQTPGQARSSGQIRRTTRKLLTAHELGRRYLDDHQSLTAIAEDVGVSRQTVARLATEYGIPVRRGRGGIRNRNGVDRDWFFEQYVTRGRTLPELAAEKGISPTTMARWAHRLDIPLRPRGEASHSVKPPRGC